MGHARSGRGGRLRAGRFWRGSRGERRRNAGVQPARPGPQHVKADGTALCIRPVLRRGSHLIAQCLGGRHYRLRTRSRRILERPASPALERDGLDAGAVYRARRQPDHRRCGVFRAGRLSGRLDGRQQRWLRPDDADRALERHELDPTAQPERSRCRQPARRRRCNLARQRLGGRLQPRQHQL
jgi:hypothetical protein